MQRSEVSMWFILCVETQREMGMEAEVPLLLDLFLVGFVEVVWTFLPLLLYLFMDFGIYLLYLVQVYFKKNLNQVYSDQKCIHMYNNTWWHTSCTCIHKRLRMKGYCWKATCLEKPIFHVVCSIWKFKYLGLSFQNNARWKFLIPKGNIYMHCITGICSSLSYSPVKTRQIDSHKPK